MGSPQCQFMNKKQKLICSKNSTKNIDFAALRKIQILLQLVTSCTTGVLTQLNVWSPLIFFIQRQPCAEPKQFVTISCLNAQQKQSLIIPNFCFSNMHLESFFFVCLLSHYHHYLLVTTNGMHKENA